MPTAPEAATAGSAPLHPLVRTVLVAVLVFVIVATMHLAAGVLLPVVEALIVWFVLNALAAGVQNVPGLGRHLPRWLALALAALAALALGYFVVQNTVRTAAALGPQASAFRDALNPLVDWAAGSLGVDEPDLYNRVVDGLRIEWVLGQVVAAMIAVISHFSIVAIYVTFLLVDQQFFAMKLRAVVRDPERRARVEVLLGRVVGSIYTYLRVMTMMSALTAVLCYAVMRLVGLEYAGFWATTIFFLNYIPTIGSILGTALPTAFALMQFQALGPVALTLAGIGAVQLVVGNILLPRSFGTALNVSLFVTLFSLFAWGSLWGVTGMFVAMPLTAMLILTLGSFEATRPVAALLSRTGKL